MVYLRCLHLLFLNTKSFMLWWKLARWPLNLWFRGPRFPGKETIFLFFISMHFTQHVKQSILLMLLRLLESKTYLIQWPAIAKNEINGTLNVTIFEVMATSIIMKSVLSSIESATPERWFISWYSNCNCLCSYISWIWNWRQIL